MLSTFGTNLCSWPKRVTSGWPALALLVVLIAGCADKAQGPAPVSPPPDPAQLKIGAGDLLNVRVYGEDELTGEYRVSSDGSINFPLIGRVNVAGKTPQIAESLLQERLADGYLKTPQVSVALSEIKSQRVTVLGQVKNPGTFAYRENLSVVEAISLAGGFTPMAKKNSVRVTRKTPGQEGRVVVAVEDISTGKTPTFFMHPGDVVFVPERLF